MGIDSYRENIIYMSRNCHVCRSEGFIALTRVVVHFQDKSIVATLNVVTNDLLTDHEAGLSELAFQHLNVKEGDSITVTHLKPITSLSDVRSKLYHNRLPEKSYRNIINDITAGLYSDIELAAFVSACAGDSMDIDEIIYLTRAMIDAGSKLSWDNKIVLDKHSVGGLPGNRTTPIVVSIVAAAGLLIPKTSSRAITSPAGTADTMATMTNVKLSIDEIKEVVKRENGCLAWGGSVNLSPADDILISVERALDIDSSGQMIASVLSKKSAAGSTHIVIDIPVGKTSKVRSADEAGRLSNYFKFIGESVGMHIVPVITDGTQPVGRGIGPVLESLDVLAVLRNENNRPEDLEEKSLHLASVLISMGKNIEIDVAKKEAIEILRSGKALKKFYDICNAQGKFTEPSTAKYRHEIVSKHSGSVIEIDNRKLSKIAKLAGAPLFPAAGVLLHVRLEQKVKEGDKLFTIYSDAEGELKYTLEYLKIANSIINIE